MFGLGTSEISLIFCTLLLFFGANRLPDLGKGIREFKDATKDIKDTVNQASVE